MNPIPRLKAYSGPAFLSYGFRPFFFLGAVQAALAIAFWVPLYEGEARLPTLFGPRHWHMVAPCAARSRLILSYAKRH